MTDTGFTDSEHAAAEELGMPVEEIRRIMDCWSKHAARLARERRDAHRARLQKIRDEGEGTRDSSSRRRATSTGSTASEVRERLVSRYMEKSGWTQ